MPQFAQRFRFNLADALRYFFNEPLTFRTFLLIMPLKFPVIA
jgi:hypothetical protein